MDVDDAIELCGHIRPTTIVPVHFDGWSHFSEGRSEIVERLAIATPDVAERFLWAPMGVPIEIEV